MPGECREVRQVSKEKLGGIVQARWGGRRVFRVEGKSRRGCDG